MAKLAIQLAVVMVAALLSPACDSPAPHQATAASPARTVSPEPVACAAPHAPADVPRDWLSTCSSAGKFGFWHPPDWYLKNCDNGNGMPYAVATFVPPRTPCNGEEYDARFSLSSRAGNVQPPEYNSQYMKKTGSDAATADGFNGTRDTFVYLTDSGFPPPKGTDLVRYVFVTAGRIYVIEYLRYPSEPDRTKAFDMLVAETLRFA
jgi:hypothetical protein